MQLTEAMDICDVCTCKDAYFLCLCTYPFPRICSACFSFHITKSSSAPHSLEPIAAKQFLTSLKSMQDYRARQSYVSAFRDAIEESVCKVSECRRLIQELAVRIREWLDTVDQSLTSLEQSVQDSVSQSIRSIEQVQYLPSYSPSTRLQQLLLDAASTPSEVLSQELSSFVFDVDPALVLQTLQKSLYFSQIPAAYTRLPNQPPSKTAFSPLLDCETTKNAVSALEPKIAEKNRTIAELQNTVSTLKSNLFAAQTELKTLKNTENYCGKADEGKTPLKRSKTSIDPGPVKTTKTDFGSGEVHVGVKCDGCGVSPVVGPRWSCKDCGDFDYCNACYHTEVHAKLHKFVRELPSVESNIS